MNLDPHDFMFEEMPVHYLEGGSGKPLLLIHGSGPGASTIGNWRRVLEPLAARYHVFAMDLIGFGRSGRKASTPFFDFDLWFRQCRALLNQMPGDDIGVVGHSISGALALKLAAAESRITRVLTTASMGASFPLNDATRLCWSFPETTQDLRRTAESLIYDKTLIDDAYIRARQAILYDDRDYADYFRSMFGHDKQSYIDATLLLPDELSRITCPVTMLHGRDDVPFPPAITLQLASGLKQADVMLLAHCAHSVAMEHPGKFLSAANLLFQ